MVSENQPKTETNARAACYQEFRPGPTLAESIECFWTSTLEATPGFSATHNVLPDGCMDIIFDFQGTDSLQAFVVGTMTRPLNVNTRGPVEMLGVRFRPGGQAAFMKFDGTELVDERADLGHFWGRSAGEAWHQLAETTAAARVNAIQKLLTGRAKKNMDGDPFVRHCVSRIEAARGSLRIGDLERTTGLSARQLERKFARQVGISPKAFARVVRFKGVLAAASAGTPDWAVLAAELGFADQAHLVREFKAFSGQTPSAFLGVNPELTGDVGFLQDAAAVAG
jgi:AraC-like DNA-binding protein